MVSDWRRLRRESLAVGFTLGDAPAPVEISGCPAL